MLDWASLDLIPAFVKASISAALTRENCTKMRITSPFLHFQARSQILDIVLGWREAWVSLLFVPSYVPGRRVAGDLPLYLYASLLDPKQKINGYEEEMGVLQVYKKFLSLKEVCRS